MGFMENRERKELMAWQSYADTQANAEFIYSKKPRFKGILVKEDKWQIILDKYVVSDGKTSATYSRFRALYTADDDFAFDIYHEGFFAKLGKILGMQDIECGYEKFDKEFIVKSNHEDMVKQVIDNAKLRQFFLDNPKLRIKARIGKNFFSTAPRGYHLLDYQTLGIVRDQLKLNEIFKMFIVTLNALEKAGFASPADTYKVLAK